MPPRYTPASIKKLLSKPDADLNAQNHFGGFTPLIYAVDARMSDLVKMLLVDDRTDVNAQCYCGNTALIVAAINGPASTVAALLEHPKIDVNVLSVNGANALIAAAGAPPLMVDGERTEIFKMLLDDGRLDTSIQERNEGLTPLTAASNAGNTDIVKLLIDRSTGRRSSTCTSTSAATESNAAAAVLDDGNVGGRGAAEQNWMTVHGGSRGEYNTDKISRGRKRSGGEENSPIFIDVNACGSFGKTALHAAASRPDWPSFVTMTNVLLSHPNINALAPDGMGATPLVYAAITNNVEALTSIIAHCKSRMESSKNLPANARVAGHICVYELEAVKKDLGAALLQAAKLGRVEASKVLLAEDLTEVNYADADDGQTPLIVAAISNMAPMSSLMSCRVEDPLKSHSEVLQLLLKDPRTDVNVKDVEGLSASDWAEKRNHTEAVRILASYCDVGRTA